MPTITIPTRSNVRTLSRRLGSTSLLSGYVSRQPSEDMLMSGGGVSNALRHRAANPGWVRQSYTGMSETWAIHNKFKDQELFAQVMESAMSRGPQGMAVTYTCKSFDPSGDPAYHEDNNRAFTRCFDIKLNLVLQPSNELYKVLGLDATDKFDATVPMQMFLKYNYQSLREHGVQPLGDPELHNPILYQRGGSYGDFNYYGYLACQIFPTNGDVIKPISQDMVYRLESFTDVDPDNMYLERKFVWKMSFIVAVDDGSEVLPGVTEDPRNDDVINHLFGQVGVLTEHTDGEPMSSSQFDSSAVIDEEAKKIVHKPIQVKDEDVLPSEDNNFYADFNRNGGW